MDINSLKENILVPVIRLKSTEKAIQVCETLVQAGYRVLEITFTIPNAEEVIRQFGSKVMTGAGTVLTKEQARRAVTAGACFLVSPALEPDVINYAHKKKVLAGPGTATPTEVHTALKLKADLVKVFPASHLGGPDYIRSLKSVFGNIILMPTGGITDANCIDYLKAGADLLGIGNWLADDKKSLSEIREKGVSLLDKINDYKKGKNL
ncbi:MAG: bifunctional 4-hydroxy-2-oxoglutarate aldolase/2-dehydro-3-deoxy-phosphogluconate aldolase [bacterium]|nr:bifunctional 4-hydroxy-2-oxoglutarate aldolase/2-dehydro-3-deoxy-phosphogluconate aldolase [bacterium]